MCFFEQKKEEMKGNILKLKNEMITLIRKRNRDVILKKKHNKNKIYNLHYKTPISVFVVFENLPFTLLNSKRNYKNTFFLVLPKNFYKSLSFFLKNELFFSLGYLIDQSCLDVSSYKDKSLHKLEFSINNIFFTNFSNKFLLFNVYYFFFSKTRLITLTFFKKSNCFESIDKIYPNSSWLERETKEMFGVNFTNKKDGRSLLLDYSKNDNPLLKEYPCEGYYEIYYNFFERKLIYIENDLIEL